jgi:3-oxosteroid 1-dehydrogenase
MREQLRDKYDLVVVGSGAAGLVGAITAAKLGLSAVIIEKATVWGGTSALSGGAMWLPANHLMAADGESDSYKEALAYLHLAVERTGRATSEERLSAFLQGAPRMLRALTGEGAALIREPHQPDYLAHLPHARVGRSVEPDLSDGRKLGDAWDTLRRYPGDLPAVRLGELSRLGQGVSTFQGIKTLLKVGIRHKLLKLFGQRPLGMGAALVAELMQVVRRLQVPVILNTRLEDLVFQDGRVSGVICDGAGTGRRQISTGNVLLSAGGFAHSAQRQELQGTDGSFSLASPDDSGDMLSLARQIGADVELLDSAWWGCVVKYPDGTPGFTVTERSTPGSILIDGRGARFTNEAQNYNLVGRDMRTRSVDPAWLIIDSRNRSKYRFGLLLPGRTPEALIESGFFKRASSIEALARACAIDPRGLTDTIDRFNNFARSGVDQDFHRGETAYERYWGDPGHHPNPNLGAIERPPYLATRVYAGDIGTRGGFVTDGHGRVLSAGKPLEGLYASGNCTATLFGRDYPGAGATLGPAMTFAFLAAEHMADRRSGVSFLDSARRAVSPAAAADASAQSKGLGHA